MTKLDIKVGDQVCTYNRKSEKPFAVFIVDKITPTGMIRLTNGLLFDANGLPKNSGTVSPIRKATQADLDYLKQKSEEQKAFADRQAVEQEKRRNLQALLPEHLSLQGGNDPSKYSIDGLTEADIRKIATALRDELTAHG